jgi:hypothetical protein
MISDTVSPAFIIVSEHDIAVRAYEIYAERGYVDGFDREDWLRAERELRAPRPIRASSQRRSKNQSTTRPGTNDPPEHAEHV